MNIIRMCGGLGNQMFQYALYLKMKSLGIECKFDDWSEYEGHDNARPIALSSFSISYPKATMEEYNTYTDSKPDIFSKIRRKITGRKSLEYAEKPGMFDKEVLTKDNAYLTGYFQSEKYFEDISEEVKKAFTFNSEIAHRAEEILRENNMDFDMSKLVSVHIRRGDYLQVSQVYGGICDNDYYERAIEYVLERQKDAEFLILTNDTGWALEWKTQKIHENPELGFRLHVLQGTDEDSGNIDMYLMTRCAHNIIANSSFSWWGAYLNLNEEKIVIAPKIWTNVMNNAEIYTKNMVKI